MPSSRTDDVLIMTKYAGLKGTCELVRKKRAELENRFSAPFLDRILALEALLSDNTDFESARRYGEAEIFEPGKEGIFAALWEFAKEKDMGLEVDIRQIPLRQETIEIANHLDVNPYEISSGGTLLIAAGKEDSETLIKELNDSGINADIIGRFNNGNDRVLINKGAKRFLTPVSRIEDEIRLRNSQKSI